METVKLFHLSKWQVMTFLTLRPAKCFSFNLASQFKHFGCSLDSKALLYYSQALITLGKVFKTIECRSHLVVFFNYGLTPGCRFPY